MKTLWEQFLHAFLYDPAAIKRWARGGMSFLAAIGGQVVIDPAWSTWTRNQWLVHCVPAVLSFFAGSITYGEKNVSPTTLPTEHGERP